MKLLISTSSPKRMSVHAHLMASRPSKIMSSVCGSHSCLFFSMSVLVSASIVRTVSFVLSVTLLLTLPVAVKCRCWRSSPSFTPV